MSERTGYAPGTPCWVDLATPDLQDALRFYGGLFGWELEDAGAEAGHYHQALVRGKRVAGIGPTQPGGPPMAVWTTYLSGSDVDRHAPAISAAGGTVIVEPFDVLGLGRMLMAQDPTGATFGIWEPQLQFGAELVNENAAMVWNELLTRDIATAMRFYGEIFDYTFEEIPESGGYQMMKVEGRVCGGMWQMGDEMPPNVPPLWMNYFHLDDVDAGFDRAREHGGELITEPRDSPYGRLA
jgi:predicted enzyme related to lactoylglutathione lyase